jgi:hypothetical protein
MAKLEAKVDTTDIEVLYPSPPLPRVSRRDKFCHQILAQSGTGLTTMSDARRLEV